MHCSELVGYSKQTSRIPTPRVYNLATVEFNYSFNFSVLQSFLKYVVKDYFM